MVSGFWFSRVRAGRVVSLLALLLATLVMSACSASPPCYHSIWLDKQACETRVISKVPYATLKQTLTRYVEDKTKAGSIQDAGIYFRDLEDGPHFGVNEYENFAAASLLKLPMVILYLSLAEEDPSLLAMKLIVPAGLDELYKVAYAPPEQLLAGQAYSVEELLLRTTKYSDNVAFIMLRQYLQDRYGKESFIDESYRHLGLVPEINDRYYVISVSRYASMFKLLYTASYLNSASSEKFVKMMLAATFDKGLLQGLPAGTPLANKFGVMERDGLIQLHDCGIVYYPNNPYVLCVMTRGHSYEELEKVLGDVSRMVYEEVDARRGRRP
jgi:beta-lactamase class A